MVRFAVDVKIILKFCRFLRNVISLEKLLIISSFGPLNSPGR